MIIPVRCITCGRVIGDKWQPYKDYLSQGKTAKEALDILGIKSYCCRTAFLSQVDLLEDISKHKKA